MLRDLLKWVIGKTVRPFLSKFYLNAERTTRVLGFELIVPVGVFHPKFFLSSKFFGTFIQGCPLQGKQVLDVGTGSGILALCAAKTGGLVTSIDINKQAVDAARKNAALNGLQLNVVHSDLFNGLSGSFDFIFINPPYYPKSPDNDKEHAWYCGDEFQYFERLFADLPKVTLSTSKIYMVLSDGCDLDQIILIANKYRFQFHLRLEKQFLMEKNFIYQIQRSH